MCVRCQPGRERTPRWPRGGARRLRLGGPGNGCARRRAVRAGSGGRVSTLPHTAGNAARCSRGWRVSANGAWWAPAHHRRHRGGAHQAGRPRMQLEASRRKGSSPQILVAGVGRPTPSARGSASAHRRLAESARLGDLGRVARGWRRTGIQIVGHGVEVDARTRNESTELCSRCC